MGKAPRVSVVCMTLLSICISPSATQAASGAPIGRSLGYTSGVFAPTGVAFHHQPAVFWPAPSAKAGSWSPGLLGKTNLPEQRANDGITNWRPLETSCSCNQRQLCPPLNEISSEKQLHAYISNIEALTGTIQELDEAVQQIQRPAARECGQAKPETSVRAIEFVSEATWFPTTPAHGPVTTDSAPATTTTESFTDPPPGSASRRKRQGLGDGAQFGMPSSASGTVPAPDRAGDDLAKASNELKALRKDLNRTAEWMQQTNHFVHSAMLKALQAYIASIEHRVDSQLASASHTKSSDGLRAKIGLVKEKVASLFEKLKALVPFKQFGGEDALGRDDQSSHVVATNEPLRPFTNRPQ